MNFAALAALSAQGSGYTVFNGGNLRKLTFIGWYTGTPSENVGKNLNPATVIPLSFSGNKTGSKGSEDYTWAAVGIRQKMPMSQYSSVEVTFTANKAGTLVLCRTAHIPTAGQGYPTTTELEAKAFSTGDNVLTFDLPATDAYMILQVQISSTATALGFDISKWRLLK